MMPSANETWLNLLETVLQGSETQPRGLKTREVLGQRTVFDMSRPVITSPERNLGYRFLAAEAWWILTGDNRVRSIAKYSKIISKFSDDGFTFRGAYGPPVVDQLGYVIDSLFKDRDTRQSVLTIWRPRPGPSKDIPCTVSLQWIIRQVDGEQCLHCFAGMRSSDTWLGVPYDVFNFSMISGFVLASLLTRCPSLNLRLGHLFFYSTSQHLYEPNWEQARDCVFERKELFTYLPLDVQPFVGDPWRLVEHLKALADADREKLKSSWLVELLDLEPGGEQTAARSGDTT